MFLIVLFFPFLAFGTITNDRVGTLLTTRAGGRARKILHSARVTRQRATPPEEQLPRLPALISMEEIHKLREQVEPVRLLSFLISSLFSYLSFYLFTAGPPMP